MNPHDSIRKNRREFVTRPPVAQGGTERPVNAPNDQPQPGESTQGIREGEGADRQAEENQAR
jgi:hypothetical protein